MSFKFPYLLHNQILLKWVVHSNFVWIRQLCCSTIGKFRLFKQLIYNSIYMYVIFSIDISLSWWLTSLDNETRHLHHLTRLDNETRHLLHLTCLDNETRHLHHLTRLDNETWHLHHLTWLGNETRHLHYLTWLDNGTRHLDHQSIKGVAELRNSAYSFSAIFRVVILTSI